MPYSPLLPVHIAGGIIGIASGAAAMVFPKGGGSHALAGKVFVASMLTMAAAAVYLATLRHQPNNVGEQGLCSSAQSCRRGRCSPYQLHSTTRKVFDDTRAV